MQQSKLLITGFSGFVSFHFVNFLNNLGSNNISVLGLDISIPEDYNKWEFNNLDISFTQCDLTDKLAVEKSINNFEPTHILHLAAFSSVGKSWQDPYSCFINNTTVFLNIVEILRINNRSTKLLCIGSSEEYGEFTQVDLPLKEILAPNPLNPYAVTKVSQEALSKCYVKGYGLDIIMTRSFNHIGPRQRDIFVIPSFVKQIAQAAVDKKKNIELNVGNTKVIRDFLDVRDVVRAYYSLFDTGKAGELYNVCSGQGYSLDMIITQLEKISGIHIDQKIDKSLIRPNDIPIIIGSNEKIKKETNWKNEIKIEDSLEDIFRYWYNKFKQ